MASAQLPNCLIDIGFTDPNGNWTSWLRAFGEQLGPGGSSDGTIATAMSNNASYKFALMGKPAYAGCTINVRFKLSVADGSDKSDWVIILPITRKNMHTGQKSASVLRASDFGTATDLVAASPIDVWYEYGTGYSVPNGEEIKLGTSPSTIGFLSPEDDA